MLRIFVYVVVLRDIPDPCQVIFLYFSVVYDFWGRLIVNFPTNSRLFLGTFLRSVSGFTLQLVFATFGNQVGCRSPAILRRVPYRQGER